ESGGKSSFRNGPNRGRNIDFLRRRDVGPHFWVPRLTRTPPYGPSGPHTPITRKVDRGFWTGIRVDKKDPRTVSSRPKKGGEKSFSFSGVDLRKEMQKWR